MTIRKGFAVSIKRKDGSTVLACNVHGILPVVWLNRRSAVEHKRELLIAGFPCRVVHVQFTDPKELTPKSGLRPIPKLKP